MSFEDQLWQWLGSGSVRLAWQGKAALQIQLDLAGDAKEAWTGLGAPTPATGFMAAGVKAAAFVAIMRFLGSVFGGSGRWCWARNSTAPRT